MIGLLSLFLASTFGYGFEVLDTTDDEWIAPGCEIVEEAFIDPVLYGEPFLYNGIPRIGAHLSFTPEHVTQAWRVVLVLDRRIVVLQEDEDPVSIPVDLAIQDYAFSPSGRFVLVHDGAGQYTGRNAARIDCETERVEYFDSQPDGSPGSKGLEATDGGVVRCGLRFFDEELRLTGELDSSVSWSWGTLSPSGRLFVVESASVLPAMLCLYATNGDLIWQNQVESSGLTSLAERIAFSPDESLMAIPLCSGIQIWDTSNGNLVWEDTSGDLPVGRPIFSGDEDHLIFPSTAGVSIVSDFREIAAMSHVSPDPSRRFAMNPYAVSASGAQVIMMQKGDITMLARRWAVVSSENAIRWISEASFLSPLDDCRNIWPSAAISSDGNRIGYTASEAVRILRLGQVSR